MENSAKNERYVAFKYRDFRLMWIGQLISNTGSQMQMVALNWHIYVLTHSALALGMIGLMRFVPIVIFSLVGGSFADAFNRKKLLLATQTILICLSTFLAIATLTHTITATIIYLITALAAAVMSFDGPARQSLTPNLVPKQHLTNAISLNTIMWQTTTIAGPTIAGLMIGKLGVGSIYGVNAVSYIASIIALLLLHFPGHIIGEKTTISFSSIKEGFSFVLSKTIIWSTMLLDFFSTFFASASALLPIFAKDILHVGPEGLGILYSAEAVGAVTAGFAMAHFGKITKQGKILLIAVTCYALGTIMFGLSKLFILSFIGLMIVGAGDSVSTIIRNTIRQFATPDNMRGRMTGINMIFFMGGPQLGEFEAGVLAAAFGGPFSVLIGGLGTLVVVGVMAAKIPILRRFETHNS